MAHRGCWRAGRGDVRLRRDDEQSEKRRQVEVRTRERVDGRRRREGGRKSVEDGGRRAVAIHFRDGETDQIRQCCIGDDRRRARTSRLGRDGCGGDVTGRETMVVQTVEL